jgi:hypothetical protein
MTGTLYVVYPQACIVVLIVVLNVCESVQCLEPSEGFV